MLTNVHLHGELGDKYGSPHRFDIASAAQSVNALAAAFPEFPQDLKDGFYHVRVGNAYIGEEALTLHLGKGRDVHIIPTIEGSKNRGGIKAVAGIVILSVATYGAFSAAAGGSLFGAAGGFAAASPIFGISYGSFALMGIGMILQGVSGLLTPMPKVGDYNAREAVDQRASFMFNGPTNRSAEGATVPLVFGTYEVGSVVISAGIQVEQLLANTIPPGGISGVVVKG